jgi:hypothetical protein
MFTLFPSEDNSQWFNLAVLLEAHTTETASLAIHRTLLNAPGGEGDEDGSKWFKKIAKVVSREVFDFARFLEALPDVYRIITVKNEVYIYSGDDCISLYGEREGDTLIVRGVCARDCFTEELDFINETKPRYEAFAHLIVEAGAFE